jgi:NADH-quinone oxidoreductase subunit N
MIDSLHPLISVLLPEVILLVGAGLVILIGLVPSQKPGGASSALSMAVLLLALWATGRAHGSPTVETSALTQDSLLFFVRLVTLSMGVLLVLVNRHVPESNERPEFFALLLCSLAGISIVALSNDLILFFLALELVSVPTYILVGLSRTDIRAQEAAGKYFFLGAFAAAITLYGFSFLYGAAGTMRLFGPDSIAAALDMPSMAADKLTLLGLLLTMSGLAFKIAAVPLHFYVADVYQGAASPVAGLLGFVPKFAGFVAIIRVLSMSGWEYSEGLFWLLWTLAAVTMTVGNTLALMQQNVKRMLAYSSIAHSGYMLVGLLAGPAGVTALVESPFRDGLSALLFYVSVYSVMNLGAFAAISFFRKTNETGGEDSVETLDDLSGVARRHPWASLAMAICALSLMGLPPTGGFLGKVYVFSAALASNAGGSRHNAMIALVVIAVLNSAIAAAYYIRIIAACYMERRTDLPGQKSTSVFAAPCHALRLGLAICALFVMFIFLKPGRLSEQTRAAVQHLAHGEPAMTAVQQDSQATRD